MAGMRDNLLVGLDSDILPNPTIPKVVKRVEVKPTTTAVNATVTVPSDATWVSVRALGSGGTALQSVGGNAVRSSAGGGGTYVRGLYKVTPNSTMEVSAGMADVGTTVRINGVGVLFAMPGQQGTGMSRNYNDLFDGSVPDVDALRESTRLCICDESRHGGYGLNRRPENGVESYKGGDSGNDYSDHDTLRIGGSGAVATPAVSQYAGPGGGGAFHGYTPNPSGGNTVYNLVRAPGPGMAVLEFYNADPRSRG